jgi:alpha-L-fucosidase 2
MNCKEIISKHTVTFSNPPKLTPADRAVDGPLMGNGDMGVAIAGDAQKHCFILCKNDFWRLKHQYGKTCPVPFGEFVITLNQFNNNNYEITQDLHSATTTGNFQGKQHSVKMTSYVAATNNLLIIELQATQKTVNAKVSLNIIGGRGCETKSGSDEKTFWGVRSFTDNVDIETGVAVSWTCIDKDALDEDGSLRIHPDKPVTLILSMVSNFENDQYLEQAKAALTSTPDYRQKHEEWWTEYWNKSYVSIDDPVIEKQYYLSLYGMGSCSRNLSFPPNIFGWVTTDHPLWQGDYHLNYNHQAPFYGLAKANRLEQADPHDSPFLDFMERAEWHCKELYGHEGGIYPVGIGPKGIETTYNADAFYPENLNYCTENGGLFYSQRSNGAYGLVNMAPRWYTTLDKDYAKRVYPFVLQMATFWQNYLTWEEANHRYSIENDSCHEGSPTDEKNSCVSLALCHLAFTLAIDLSNALNQNTERIEKWEHILKHLSKGGTHELEGKTVFRYTDNGREWWENNTIGIQQVYPAGQIGPDSDSDLKQVAKNTVDVMQRWHDTNGSNSFFPAAVRVGYDSNIILEELNKYSTNTEANGFQKGNPHGIENLSTVPNTVNEMLCTDHGGLIRLFYGWPKNRNASFVNIRCEGAFLVSANLIDNTICNIKIVSEKGSTCNVLNPWQNSSVKIIRNGTESESKDGDKISFDTQEDEIIEIHPF